MQNWLLTLMEIFSIRSLGLCFCLDLFPDRGDGQVTDSDFLHNRAVGPFGSVL
jgi:hypothetical protein